MEYQDNFPWAVNIAELAGSLKAKVANLEARRQRVSSGPNAPELRQNEVAAIDAELQTARWHASAAAQGKIAWDPRDVSGCDPRRQRWVSEARQRGMLVTPGETSVHDTDPRAPIKVIRGGGGAGANNLGSPTMSVR